MAHNLRKGKAAVRDTSITSTDETPGPSVYIPAAVHAPASVPSRSPSPALTKDDITRIVSEQLILALSTLKIGDSQTPLIHGNYDRPDQYTSTSDRNERQDTVIPLVELLVAQRTSTRNGPIRGTDAQELSDGVDPTFEAWRLQVLARFRDDPDWYNSEERKLDYMLRRTKAKNRFRVLQMGSTESFPQFRTRFLLLAHESHLRPEDYRDELWHRITPTLGLAVAALESQMVTYDQLADCLLATDTNLR
jgi:hypothetical protein